MNLPNFIILGAGKSGTTTINYLINQHHDVFMSPVKEPNFLTSPVVSISGFRALIYIAPIIRFRIFSFSNAEAMITRPKNTR